MSSKKDKKRPSLTPNPKSNKTDHAGFVRAEEWLSNNHRRVFIALSFLTLFFSFLLFDLRISEGGDDSVHIFAGFKYSQAFFSYFYTNNAPLYPMLLSIPIKLFGINLVLLKCLSTVFYFLSFLFFFKALKNRIPFLVLFAVLFFYSINSYLQYFSSQTYNEAFFLFVQFLFLFYFFKLLDKIDDNNSIITIQSNWKYWLITGLLITVISITKNLGVVLFPVVILFFLFQKQWKNAFAIGIFSIGTRLIYSALKMLIWGSRSQFEAQSNSFLKKDPYIPENGSEDLSGMISRFIENCNLYLSKRIPQIFGFKDAGSIETSGLLSFLVILLFIVALVVILRQKNKILLFVWLYVGGMVFASFVALQVIWDQPRLIVIHVPFLLLIFCFLFYKYLSKYQKWQWLYFGFVGVISVSILLSSFKTVAKDFPVLRKNMKGDLLYGYTPDWQHFLNMSQWCADSLPINSVVVSRKAGVSFIYSKGKEFFSINRLLFFDPKTLESNPDSVLTFFKEKNIKYVIVENFRKNPLIKNGETVNTMAALLSPVFHKYPEKIKFLHREGVKDDEPCFLYEINY